MKKNLFICALIVALSIVTFFYFLHCKPTNPELGCVDSAGIAKKFVKDHRGFKCVKDTSKTDNTINEVAAKPTVRTFMTIFGGITLPEANNYLSNYYDTPILNSELQDSSWLVDVRDIFDIVTNSEQPDYIQVFLGRADRTKRNKITLVLAGVSSHIVGGMVVPHHQSYLISTTQEEGVAEYVTPCPKCPDANDYKHYINGADTAFISHKSLQIWP